MDEKMQLNVATDSSCRMMALSSTQRSLTPPRPPMQVVTPQALQPSTITLGQMAQLKPGGVK